MDIYGKFAYLANTCGTGAAVFHNELEDIFGDYNPRYPVLIGLTMFILALAYGRVVTKLDENNRRIGELERIISKS